MHEHAMGPRQLSRTTGAKVRVPVTGGSSWRNKHGQASCSGSIGKHGRSLPEQGRGGVRRRWRLLGGCCCQDFAWPRWMDPWPACFPSDATMLAGLWLGLRMRHPAPSRRRQDSTGHVFARLPVDGRCRHVVWARNGTSPLACSLIRVLLDVHACVSLPSESGR
jgi:hypothetical protein